MLQQDEADDFVLATGKTIPVREFVDLSFKEVGVEIQWSGEGINEKGKDKATGEIVVEVDPKYFRPTEVDLLIGDPSKAKEKLGWEATRTVEELCRDMVKADLERFTRDKHLMDAGHDIIQSQE